MEAVQQILSVVFVFSLLALVAWALRGRGNLLRFAHTPKGESPLERIDRLILTPQHSLHLVRLSGKELLIATHPQGCTVVSEAPALQKGAGA